MPPESHGVTAAPNRSEITALVLEIKQSDQFTDKWYLDIEILESRRLSGANFARPGQKAKAFVVGSSAEITPGTKITAEAEYLGDARGGQFQLSEVRSAA